MSPFVVRKVRGKPFYRVTNAETGQVHAEHATKAKARAQIQIMEGKGTFYPSREAIKHGAGDLIDLESHNGKGVAHTIRKVRGKELWALYKNGVKHSEHDTRGGALLASEVKGLTEASYKDRKHAPEKVGNLTLDKELSKGKARVYVDPEGKATVVTRGTKGISDWKNNLAYLTGNYKKTDRYKVSEGVAKAAKAKYGSVQALGHSQGAVASRILTEKGIASNAIVLNPASKGEKPQKNVTVVKSSRDQVSLLQKTRSSDVIIPSSSFNPLKNHSTDVLGAVKPDQIIGGHKRNTFIMDGPAVVPMHQFPPDPVKTKKR
jgi:hypothetical protein